MEGGGIESMIAGLVNEIVNTHSVTLCTIFEPKASDLFYNKLDPRITKISIGKKISGVSPTVIFKIYYIIKNGKYDVVHIHGFFYYYVIAVLLLHKKVQFFYTVHSDAVRENAYWDRKIFWLKRFCFRKKYVCPVTISGASQESFSKLYQCSSELIYNGAPLPKISTVAVPVVTESRISPHTKILLHPGRIDVPKNQLVLCRVCKRLIDEGEDIVLLIAGNKQSPEIFKTLEPYFSDRIKYIGERPDIPTLLHQADAMCLPSIWEGLPVTLLEALSVGCIPICSPVGGIVDVIDDGINGFLSKSSSEADYYRALKFFLHLSTDEIAMVKINCLKSFDCFHIKNTAAQYLSLYGHN